MKTFHFILNGKGGCGKSTLVALLALKNEKNPRSYFIDLDASVKTSTQQLKFLQGHKPPRFAVINLLDGNAKIDRQLLFENLLELCNKDYDDFYCDFGSGESANMISLFTLDYSVEEFKQIQDELDAKFTFNIVVAGGASYEACTAYLHKLSNLIDGYFDLNIYINQSTFKNHPHLIDELISYATVKKNKISSVKLFGDFDVTTSPHKNILIYIEKGRGMEAYVFIEKIKILKELAKL